MTTFRAVGHSTEPSVVVIEVWEDNQLTAVIYPKHRGVKIVSKYLGGRLEDLVMLDPAIPPAMHIRIWSGKYKP
jgi:hypothetical protein